MIMENALSSPRKDKFPAGLRVLVVDDDLTWLKILEKMLKKCSYQVTTCYLARDALTILRERKEKFDIVISDVNMPDMDGFKLLEHVGLEMDLPVIMMSVDGETSRVMKGVRHGACDYLLKPIRMKELSNIWQHVYRKKMNEIRNTENHRGLGNVQLVRDESDDSSDRNPSKGSLDEIEKMTNVKKRRHGDQDSVESPSSKKSRVVWSIELHQKFLDAVNHIGLDKLGPKKILDTMNVPGLTRDNVASHLQMLTRINMDLCLQKFRLYLNRLQCENEQKNSPVCVKQQEVSSGDSMSSFDFQNSSTHITSACINYGYATNEIPVDGTELKYDEAELTGMVSFSPVTKPKKPLTSDLSVHRKAGISTQRKPSHSLNSLECGFYDQPFELTVPATQRPGSYLQQDDNFCLQPRTTIDSQSSFQGYNSVNRSLLLSANKQTAASGLAMASPIVSTKYPCTDQNYAGKQNLLGNITIDEPTLLSLEENVQSGLFQGYCGSGIHINDHYSLGLMADMGFRAQQFG